MKKFSQIAAMAMAVLFIESFALADTPAGSAQTTPTVKSQGKAKSKAAGKTVSKTQAKTDKKIAAKDAYICPMCHITAAKPGKCPMCGMDMVKNDKKDEKKAGDEKKM